jgi:hypothetical protein
MLRSLDAVELSKLSMTSTSGPSDSTETNPSGVFQSDVVAADWPGIAGLEHGVAPLYRSNTDEA